MISRVSLALKIALAKVQIERIIIPSLRGVTIKTGFGWIEIGDQLFEHDIVIHTDGSISKWEKKISKPLNGGVYEHTPLSKEELGFLAEEQPVQVFIGTGQYGSLPLTPEAKIILACYQSVILPTPQLLREMKRSTGSYVAVLHVTC